MLIKAVVRILYSILSFVSDTYFCISIHIDCLSLQRKLQILHRNVIVFFSWFTLFGRRILEWLPWNLKMSKSGKFIMYHERLVLSGIKLFPAENIDSIKLIKMRCKSEIDHSWWIRRNILPTPFILQGWRESLFFISVEIYIFD